ncbi:MAG: Maf family protein [Acidiferrobacterales bacterium]|nr:Maf family protein [Acidiferrobacterales bacterium]
MNIILASQSPRRKELLGHLVKNFDQQSADIDESVKENETPVDYVERLALQKAAVIFNRTTNSETALVIGSDTTVVKEGRIMGKPEDLDDCISMLMSLSDSNHEVLTAFSVVTKAKTVTRTVTTQVNFVSLNESKITKYWKTGEPHDKAGAYAIQGIGGQFVKSINGSVSAVVGLPLAELAEVLEELGAI